MKCFDRGSTFAVTQAEANLVLVRHGQSLWNRERRLTGWSNVPLSDHGRQEARAVARLLERAIGDIDLAYTSSLDRASETLEIILDALDLRHIPVQQSWRLNERHYGATQGMSRSEVAQAFGLRQLFTWQQSFDERPPAVACDDLRNPALDPRYHDLREALLPRTESMRDTMDRVIHFWHTVIEPEIRRGKRVLVVAHKTSLRALRKHLEGVADSATGSLSVGTGEPILYALDGNLQTLWHRSLKPGGRLKSWARSGVGKWIQSRAQRSDR